MMVDINLKWCKHFFQLKTAFFVQNRDRLSTLISQYLTIFFFALRFLCQDDLGDLRLLGDEDSSSSLR